MTSPEETQPRGRYIVFEGADGVGKSTQVEKMVGHLATLGIESRGDIREPGGTPEGEKIREWLKNPNIERTPEENLTKFNQARLLLQEQVIIPELKSGKWVICDRDRLSSHAYQGYGEGLDLTFVREECKEAMPVMPDLELILEVEEEERQRRLSEEKSSDYFEQMNEATQRRIVEGYVKEAKILGIPAVDGNGTPEEVHQRLRTYVDPFIESYLDKKHLVERSTNG